MPTDNHRPIESPFDSVEAHRELVKQQWQRKIFRVGMVIMAIVSLLAIYAAITVVMP